MRCTKTIHAGPGHQSEHQCVIGDEQHHHHVSEDIGYFYEWSDCHYQMVDHAEAPMAFSTFFNLSPGHCDKHHAITGEPL